MSRNRIIIVTIGIMLSLFLASMESTVVGTAAPTIVGQLGGLEHYAWLFSAYMLASTTTVPLYGKLSDLYGRRKVYLVAMTLFLTGSIFSGQAQTMTQLILARALQGIGAGGILPLAFTLIGEMFSLEQRTKMQGVFSGVWGVSSIIGPLLGGFLVDSLSWHWVFYINIIPGLLAASFVGFGWRDQNVSREKPAVDYAGAGLLVTAIVTLLLGLTDELAAPLRLGLVLTSLLLFTLLLWVERRAVDPILPVALFRERLFAATIAHGVLAGAAMFGSISYVPLFVQSVLGTSATRAGITMSPMLLGWVTASIIGTRIMLRVGFRQLALLGTSLLTVGAFLMSRITPDIDQRLLMVFVALMGLGMGFSIPPFLIAVQTVVERRYLGTATSTMQFSRSMGGTLGVSIMGAVLTARLTSELAAAQLDPSLVSQILEPGSSSGQALSAGLRLALTDAVGAVFVIACAAASLALLSVFFAPKMELKEQGHGSPSQAPVSVD